MRPQPPTVEMVLDRDIFPECIAVIARRAVIVDLGAHEPQQKQLREYRPLFSGVRYYATDLSPHPGLDFVADAQDIPLQDASVDAILCHSLLEHVFEPTQVAREMFRVLKPDGVAFVYVPFLYAYHGDPRGKGPVDCYRFSPDAIRYLFRDFARIQIQPVSRAVEASLRLLMARFGRLEPAARRLGRFVDGRRGGATGVYQASGYNIWLEKGRREAGGA
jgi:SAM-dependent methyltransferase